MLIILYIYFNCFVNKYNLLCFIFFNNGKIHNNIVQVTMGVINTPKSERRKNETESMETHNCRKFRK